MLVFVRWDCEVSDDGDFVALLSLVFGVCLVNDVIGSPRRESIRWWHRVSCLFHLLVGPFREVPLACFPHVSVSRN